MPYRLDFHIHDWNTNIIDNLNAHYPPLSTPNQEPPVIYSSKHKPRAWIISVISVVIVLVAIGIAAFFLNRRYKFVIIDTVNDQIQFDSFYTELPLNLNNPAIIRSSVLYSLHGEILDVKNNNGKVQIISNIKEQGKNLIFNMIDRSIIQIFDHSNFRQGNIGDIKPGRTMSIVGEYWNIGNLWVINYIVLDTPPESTPAAKLKR